MKLWAISAVALLLIGTVVPSARADSITITSGSATIASLFAPGTISIAGTEGFSFQGDFGSPQGAGSFSCMVPPCAPGTPLVFSGGGGSSDEGGTATLNGVTYLRG